MKKIPTVFERDMTAGTSYLIGVTIGLFFGGLIGWAFTAHHFLANVYH